MSKHADILKFLLHRDKFLHISAVGSKQEMHNYMRQELEKLRNAKYDNPYSQEIINNLHYESQSIAYYVDDWKFLYYLKMFPNKKVYEIPVNLQKESLEKYAKIIQQCQEEKDEDDIKNDNDIQEEDNNNDVEMNGNKGNDDMTNIERKRKNMNDSNHTDKPSVVESSNKNNNDAKSPRKKRKTLERKPKHDNGYNTAQLCMDQDYLTYDQKSALFEAFEFTTLIESVWNLSRKAFITAFINIELDLPSMSGLQSCVELGWSILPQFKELPDDLDTDFDETLSLYKDFNKEKQVRSRAPFPGSLLSHHNANNSDDDAPIQNGLGLAAMNTGFKWEDYDTLEDDSSSDEDENGVSIVDPIPDNDRRMKNRELPHVPQAVRRGTGSYQGTPLGMAWDPMTVVTGISQSGGNKNDSDDEKKQQKSRFRVHSDDGDNDKSDTPKKSHSNDGDDSKMDQDEDDEDDQVNVPQEPAYGEYDEVGDDLRAKEEVRDSDNYIGYINRKEFKLDMKKRRIIRRSKTKEYRDRIDKYGTCDFLYTQIKDYIDPPNKKKRSKHKYVQNVFSKRVYLWLDCRCLIALYCLMCGD